MAANQENKYELTYCTDKLQTKHLTVCDDLKKLLLKSIIVQHESVTLPLHSNKPCCHFT